MSAERETTMSNQEEIQLADIMPGGKLHSAFFVGSLPEEVWETLKTKILDGTAPESWRELLKGALSDE